MTSAESEPTPSLLELVDPDRWQRLQDHFARVLGIGLRTFSPSGRLLIPASWPVGLEEPLLNERFRLAEELTELFPSPEAMPRTVVSVTRPLGISFAAIPLKVIPDRRVGFWVVGPVVLGRREESDSFRQRIDRMGLDPEPIWELLVAVKLYSYNAFKSVLSLLEEIANMLIELTYQGRPKHLWQSLLEVACSTTRAQGGSVMLYESESRSFRIAAQQGLAGDWVRATRVKVGEGIAGLAAQRGQILLVDDTTQDPELKERMLRKELVSSIVAPFPEATEKALGILNLRTSDALCRFTAEDIEILRKLMQLIQTAFAASQLFPGGSSSS